MIIILDGNLCIIYDDDSDNGNDNDNNDDEATTAYKLLPIIKK
jgi:hypothetical protein